MDREKVTAQIIVVGLGVEAVAILSDKAKQAFIEADVIVGSPRQFAMIAPYLNDESKAKLKPLSGFKALKAWLTDYLQTPKTVCMLASGDPLFYGVGRWVYRHFPSVETTTHPAISSIQAACHRLGLAQQHVSVVSLHGRALSTLRRHLHHGETLVVLTDKNSSPKALALECQQAGLGLTQISVCERLGYADERVRTFDVATLIDNEIEFDPLHVSALVLKKGNRKQIYPNFPGIDDAEFSSGESIRLLTKKPVRVVILSMLQVGVGEVVWDIGAGCGGVSVELAYWQPKASIYAVEHHLERLKYLAENQEKFGVVNNLVIENGRAPECLADLPNPDKVFVGGSDGALTEILTLINQRLNHGGTVVVSAVTENAKSVLNHFADDWLAKGYQVEAQQVGIATAESLAGQRVFRPQLPVTLYCFKKVEVSRD